MKVFSGICLALLLVLSSCGKKADSSWVFIQRFFSGTMTPIEGEQGYYRLDLKVWPELIAFNDRTSEDTQMRKGTVPMDKFLTDWTKGKDSFRKDPPNAALVISQTEKSLVLELMDPTYDSKTSHMTYKVRFSDKEHSITNLPQTVNEAIPEFGGGDLFIDDWASSAYANFGGQG